jgi:hypothetical protein
LINAGAAERARRVAPRCVAPRCVPRAVTRAVAGNLIHELANRAEIPMRRMHLARKDQFGELLLFKHR